MKPIANINVGDPVSLYDHSYHLDLSLGKLTQLNGVGGFHSGDVLILVAKRLTLPAHNNTAIIFKLPLEVNDCIVWNRTKDIYFFTQEQFLRKV